MRNQQKRQSEGTPQRIAQQAHALPHPRPDRGSSGHPMQFSRGLCSPVDGLLRARESSGLVGLTLGPGDVSMYGVAPRMCVE